MKSAFDQVYCTLFLSITTYNSICILSMSLLLPVILGRLCILFSYRFRSVVLVQSLSCVQIFATPWTAAHQASLSFTNSQSKFKLMSIELMMSSNHLILCRPLLHPTISSSVVPFFFCFESLPASGFFLKSKFFTSSGQSIGV